MFKLKVYQNYYLDICILSIKANKDVLQGGGEFVSVSICVPSPQCLVELLLVIKWKMH